MNVFAKFDEIPSMILQDIKETKRQWAHGRTYLRLYSSWIFYMLKKYTQQVSFREPGRTDGFSDNVKTVYPPTNTDCGGGGIISHGFHTNIFNLREKYHSTNAYSSH